MINGVHYALYALAAQREQQIEEASREAWKYQGLALEHGPGVRARLAAGLVALAARLAPEAARRAEFANPTVA